MKDIQFGNRKTRWEHQGIEHSAHLVVGHTEDQATVVIGVESGLAEPTLAFLPISEAERFWGQLGDLIKQMRKAS